MRFRAECGCLGVPAWVSVVLAETFGPEPSIVSFDAIAEAAGFLARAEFPFGRIFVTSGQILDNGDDEIRLPVATALNIPTFHLVVIDSPLGPPPYISPDHHNFHIVDSVPSDIRRS